MQPSWRSVELPTARRRRAYRAVKRTVDVAGASFLLLALLPFALVVVIAIRLDSPGPAVFRQQRVGARYRSHRGVGTWRPETFTMLKLRTMVRDADETVHVQRIERYVRGEATDGRGPAFKPQDDPRVTRVGRRLRAWSLDELPQLVNVVRGDLSLVGPRPVPTYEADNFTVLQLRRFTTRPGLTGLWQIAGRSELSFDEAVARDLEYVDRQSLAFDLQILLRTVIIVLTKKGAA